MKVTSRKRVRFTLWILLAVLLAVMTAGTIFAAGEELERSAVLSGGNTQSSGGLVLRDVIGLWAAGSYVASSGGSLCSGFGCSSKSSVIPDESDPDPNPNPDPDPSMELFMPSVNKAN